MEEKTLTDWLFGYYGVDWIAMVCTATSAYKLGNKQRSGWLWGIGANISFIIFNAMAASVAGILANIIFGALNVRGLIRWWRDTHPPSSDNA